VLCRIRPGRAGACSRYANEGGTLVRTDPAVLLAHQVEAGGPVVAFAEGAWDGKLLDPSRAFVTGIGAGTTYPDYKPAPFIVGSTHDGVDTVTVVTEGIFSYCGVKVKIDTDRHLGPEAAAVRAKGEQVGHVTTAEYGRQMLSLGGVRHLTGGSKREGNVTCDTLLKLCAAEPVELTIDGGHSVVVQAGAAPIVDGKPEHRMRVGCGSATVGIFAQQWLGHADEVIVVDDHITGVLSEHQAGKVLGMRPTGIRVRGRRSTPGRYFQVANPGLGWGGTDITDPLSIIEKVDPAIAWPGLRLLLTSTTARTRCGACWTRRCARAGRDAGAVRRVVERIGRELRTLALHRAVHGGRGRQPARGRDGEPGAAHPLRRGGRDAGDDGRRARLSLAGRRHHRDGRRDAPAEAPSATCRPRPSSRPSSSPCRARSTSASGGHMAEIVPVEELLRGLGPALRVEGWQPANPWPFPRRWRARRSSACMATGCTCGMDRSTLCCAPGARRTRSAQRRPRRRRASPPSCRNSCRNCRCSGGPLAESPAVQGPVARRMVAACAPFARRGVFVTAMAAVAGAVADELLEAMRAAAPIAKAYVNDGGDIACHVAPGESLAIGMAANRMPGLAWMARVHLTAGGGIATSGRPRPFVTHRRGVLLGT
jgi:hypothetical protein